MLTALNPARQLRHSHQILPRLPRTRCTQSPPLHRPRPSRRHLSAATPPPFSPPALPRGPSTPLPQRRNVPGCSVTRAACEVARRPGGHEICRLRPTRLLPSPSHVGVFPLLPPTRHGGLDATQRRGNGRHSQAGPQSCHSRSWRTTSPARREPTSTAPPPSHHCR
ncbi:hypothetical protein PVAP13_2NG562600 [Panicum virgatum]|uniref:Uncharacterized protein n=1 Tax=Panicum virgatum TaxID=38727 RepID=A0A8T0VXY1_PANVG|nr:hypothetical protein PVAP13_2NG562600 [Panicum virgatum]